MRSLNVSYTYIYFLVCGVTCWLHTATQIEEKNTINKTVEYMQFH